MLSPLALQNADMLRALAADWVGSKTAFAASLGRDKSNFGKTWAKLEDEGLVLAVDGGLALTAQGQAARKLANIAEGLAALPAGALTAQHDELFPDPNNARTDWESPDAVADLRGLAIDIADKGVLQNLLVRPPRNSTSTQPGMRQIVEGERRWRAIGLGLAEGLLPAGFPIPIVEFHGDDLAATLAALAANIQRRNLSEIEEGHAFRRLRLVFGLETDAIAAAVNKTRRHVQGRLQLIEHLTPEDQARMALPKTDENRLTVRGARAKVQTPKAVKAAPLTPAMKAVTTSPHVTLSLLELAHKGLAHADNDVDLNGETGFVPLARWPEPNSTLDRLNALRVIILRRQAGRLYAKIMLHGSGAGAWLLAQGMTAEAAPSVRDGCLTKAMLEAGLETTDLRLDPRGLAQGRDYWTANLNRWDPPPAAAPGVDLTLPPVTSSPREAGLIETLIATREDRAATADPSPVTHPLPAFTVGQPLQMRADFSIEKWRGVPFWCCGVKTNPGGAYSYSITETWPPKAPADITADMDEEDLEVRP